MEFKRDYNLHVLGVDIQVECHGEQACDMIARGFSHLLTDKPDSKPALVYELGRLPQSASFTVHLAGTEAKHYDTDYEFLYFFEKSITMELQKIRHDLFVIHSAALEYKNNACLLVAESGSGKSTTCWALLHNGFNYLSDELASIDLNTMKVHAYPHALCLKKEPPPPFGFPDGTLYTSHTKHIPTDQLPCSIIDTAVPLVAVFFVKYDPDAASPSLSAVSSAESGARIYANTLNLLAHDRFGLDGAVKIGSHCRSYDMTTAGLQASCDLIKSEMDRLSE